MKQKIIVNNLEKKKNFLNSQNYIKNEYFGEKLSFFLKRYLFLKNFFYLTLIYIVVYYFFSQLNLMFSGDLVINKNNIYYTNNTSFLGFLAIFLIFIIWFFIYKKTVKNLLTEKLDLKKFLLNYKKNFIFIFLFMPFLINNLQMLFNFFTSTFLYSFLFFLAFLFINIFLLLKIDSK